MTETVQDQNLNCLFPDSLENMFNDFWFQLALNFLSLKYGISEWIK